MKHINTSLGAMRRAPFQAMAAIAVLAITFFVATLLSIVVYGSNNLVRYVETRPQVIAFLDLEAEEAEIKALQEQIASDPRVSEVIYVSKEQALDIYKDATSDNPALGELVSPSTFPASLEFSLTDLSYASDIISEINEQEIVDSVGFTASIGDEEALDQAISRLKSISYYVRISGAAAVAILTLTSLLVLMVVISMRITMKRAEIEALSLIGASPGFIRAPIILEGLYYAVIGVFFGWLMASVLIMYATPSIVAYFDQIEVLPSDTLVFFGLLGAIFAAELIIGILIALIGSYTAVSRSLKLKAR